MVEGAAGKEIDEGSRGCTDGVNWCNRADVVCIAVLLQTKCDKEKSYLCWNYTTS